MADRYWVGGSGNWSDTNRWSTSSGGGGGASVPTSADNVIFDAGSNVGAGAFTVTVDGTTGSPSICADFSTGGAGGALDGVMTLSMSNTSFLDCYGSLTLPASNLTWTGIAGATVRFKSTSTGKTITSNGVTFTSTNAIFDGVGGGWTFGSNFTSTFDLTLTNGSVDLGNYIIAFRRFNSSNANTRSIAFGTGKIQVTGTAEGGTTVVNMTTSTNFSYTGSGLLELTNSGSGTKRCGLFASATSSLSVTNSAGTGVTQIIGGVKDVDIQTGGLYMAEGATTVYGNITLASGTAVTAPGSPSIVTLTTSATQTISADGATIPFPVTKSGTGTLQLLTNLTLGSTRNFLLSQGTLDLTGGGGNRTLTAGSFTSNNSNVRSIIFGTGKISVANNNATVWNCADITNFTYTGTPTVEFTYSGSTGTRTITHGTTGGSEVNAVSFAVTAGTDTVSVTSNIKNLNFTGFSGTFANADRNIYGNLTFSAGITLTDGASATTFAATSGTQQITTAGKTLDFPLTFNGVGGTFAFQDALTQGSTRNFTVTNGTVQLKDGATSTVGNFLTSGTSQKFLRSTLAGTQATLSEASGTVNANNLTIQDINATGGATWNAYVDSGNIDAGNNDGWDFGISPVVGGVEYTYSVRSFTQPRRF
jgi:hypothetical protein